MRTLLALFSVAAASAADLVNVESPNRQVRFALSAPGRYTVSLRGHTVIADSPLAITVDGVNLADGARAGKPETYKVKEAYPWLGVHSTARAECNGARIPFTGSTAYRLEVRACNDGVAFRHIVPGEGARTPDEATSFRLPGGAVVWHHDLEGHYEALHKRSEIGAILAGTWAAPPLTFQLPAGAGYASVTEGALLDYSGMVLQADGAGGFAARLGHAAPPSYPFRLRYKEDIERVSRPAVINGTITTPWRIIMAAADLNGLVNCDLVHSVSPAPDPKYFPKGLATDWVKPGRAVWKYLDGGENNAETVREFSRLAAELGFEYQVVEGFWAKWPKAELKAVIDESRGRGVGLWLWKHSNQLRTPAARQEFFDLCREVGAAGVKIDFFDHEAREVVQFYEIMLREAAERKLLVNFHGANKPTGESRAWPNELTREGVRGMESRKSDRAQHDATLPFTRFLAGHADYTPMHFGERRNDTTWAHQVATAAAFTSPLLTYAAHPKSILANPAVDMIRSIPSVWDETIALPASEIGQVAVLARRKGATWFLALVNGVQARSLTVNLGFLGSGAYKAMLVRDDKENPAAVQIEKVELRRSDSIRAELRPGGGFIARFVR